jgi:hypothetical protein
MEIISARPDLEQVIKLYGSFLLDYDYMMRTFDVNDGRIRFSPRLHQLTLGFKCQNYPELYQDETRIQATLLRAFFDNDEVMNQFLVDLSSRSVIEQSVFMNEFIQNNLELGQCIDENVLHIDDFDWSPYGQAKALSEWEELTQEEQQQGIRFGQYFLMFSLASFYNFIALMVHGRKLTHFSQ